MSLHSPVCRLVPPHIQIGLDMQIFWWKIFYTPINYAEFRQRCCFPVQYIEARIDDSTAEKRFDTDATL